MRLVFLRKIERMIPEKYYLNFLEVNTMNSYRETQVFLGSTYMNYVLPAFFKDL